MTNEITLNYEGSLRANVDLPNGNNLVINAPASYGGCGDASPSPKDLFLAGYASCVAMTMDMAGKKNGLQIDGSKFILSAVWAKDKPVILEINTTVVLPAQLAEDQLDVLRKGAHNCPIHNSLRPEVKTTIDFTVA
ncbi:MAG: OsmC family protein [Planctomycetota bacterium]